jgi:phosphomannomutase
MSDNNLKNIFKAYDVRGRVGSELNSDSVQNMGQALGLWLPQTGIVAVGRDMRPDSAELASAMIEGLRAQGRDVWDIGEVTSDMIYFAVGEFGLAGGAMITASHNPGDYNGIKFCHEEAKPIGEESGLLEIRDLTLAADFPTDASLGNVTKKDVTEDWITHVLSFVDADKLRPLKIAVDAGNGMAGKIFPELEPHVPFIVDEMYFELDGTFPNHIANPLIPENIVDLQNKVLEQKLDAGIAFDGDGDRAVVVDEKGVPLTGTVVTALLAEYFLDKEPGSTVLFNAICGRAALDVIERKKGVGIRTRVGHSFIKGDMRKHNAIFAGEHSGHYYFRDNFMADSGIIAAIIVLYILGRNKKPLSELVQKYREAYVQISETNFEVNDKQATIAAIAEAFTNETQDTLDGLTVNFADAWFNVRPSNTEPVLRFNAEAKTQEQLDAIVAKVTKLIES